MGAADKHSQRCLPKRSHTYSLNVNKCAILFKGISLVSSHAPRPGADQPSGRIILFAILTAQVDLEEITRHIPSVHTVTHRHPVFMCSAQTFTYSIKI